MDEVKQVIVIRTDLGMKRGKIAAQACHASVEAYKKAVREIPKIVDEWNATGCAKIVLKVDSLEELLAIYNKAKVHLPSALITDAGRTQIAPGTITAVGIGPAKSEDIDKITQDLKLL